MPAVYITNALICFAASLIGLLVFIKIYSEPLLKKRKEQFYYALTWLFLAAVTFFIGLSVIADWFSRHQLEKIIFYVTEIISFATIIIGAHFVHYEMKLSKSVFRVFRVIFSILFILFVYFLGRDGLILRQSEFFGTTFALNIYSRSILFLAIIILFILAAFYVAKKKNLFYSNEKMVLALTLLLFAAASILAQSGLVNSWQLIVCRLFMLLSSVITYLMLDSVVKSAKRAV